MIKHIDLPYRTVLNIAEEPLILPENELKLIFTSRHYTGLNLKIFARINGKTTAYNASANEVVDLTRILQAGVLEIEIKHFVKGEMVKRWEISPIIIKEEVPSFVLREMLGELEARVEELEKQHKPIL